MNFGWRYTPSFQITFHAKNHLLGSAEKKFIAGFGANQLWEQHFQFGNVDSAVIDLSLCSLPAQDVQYVEALKESDVKDVEPLPLRRRLKSD